MRCGIYEDNKSIFETVGHIFRTWSIEPNGDGYYMPLHWHHHIEIIYALEGGTLIQIEEENFVMDAGDLALIFPKEEHSLCVPPNSMAKYIVISFKTDLVYAMLSVVSARYILPFLLGDRKYPKIFKQCDMWNTSITSLPENIFKEYIDGNFGFELSVKIMIEQLMLELIKHCKSEEEQTDKSGIRECDMAILKIILEYVYKNYMEDLSIEKLAKKVGLSYSYFSRFFKKLTGVNYADFLINVRVSEAARLLLSSEDSVTSIAMETGFSCSSHLIKQFKLIKGQTPLQYRKTKTISNSHIPLKRMHREKLLS